MSKKTRTRYPGQPSGLFGAWMPWIVGHFLPPLVRLWGASFRQTRVNVHHLDEATAGEGGILVAWHGNLLLSLYGWRDRGAVGMVSPVWIGELIARTMRGLGFESFRASSGYSPAAGLKQSLRILRQGKVLAQVPDGPEGPPRVVKPGVIYLASISGKPIIPSYIGAMPKWQMTTWDRHEVARPFSRLEARVAEPFYVPPKLDKDQVEYWCRELERRMYDLEAQVVLSLFRLNYREIHAREAGLSDDDIRKGRWRAREWRKRIKMLRDRDRGAEPAGPVPNPPRPGESPRSADESSRAS